MEGRGLRSAEAVRGLDMSGGNDTKGNGVSFILGF